MTRPPLPAMTDPAASPAPRVASHSPAWDQVEEVTPRAAEPQALQRPRPSRVRLRDVAYAAGISESTASRALGGYPDVAPQTRERVQRLVRELGYRASARARSLAAGSAAALRCGVVIFGASAQEFGRSFFASQLLFGLMGQATTERLDIHLLPLPDALGDGAAALDRLVAEDRADGYLLFVAGRLRPEDVAPFEQRGVPFALVLRHFDERPVFCATVDFEAATASTARRFHALGHRRLLLLLPDHQSSTTRDHERGWRQAVAELGLSPQAAPGRHYVYTGDHAAAARVLMRELFQQADDERPTAVACFNDFCASGVLAAAQDAGLMVPGDLSIVGFDNLIAPWTSPTLCSYECHIQEVGATAARLLARQLHGEAGPPERVRLMPEFIARESCGLAPRG